MNEERKAIEDAALALGVGSEHLPWFEASDLVVLAQRAANELNHHRALVAAFESAERARQAQEVITFEISTATGQLLLRSQPATQDPHDTDSNNASH